MRKLQITIFILGTAALIASAFGIGKDFGEMLYKTGIAFLFVDVKLTFLSYQNPLSRQRRPSYVGIEPLEPLVPKNFWTSINLVLTYPNKIAYSLFLR